MKRTAAVIGLVVLIVASLVSFSRVVSAADEVKMIANIKTITLAKDGQSATVVLTNEKDNKDVTVYVDDDLTLSKFKDHRIIEGDEIRLKFEVKDGKNHSTYFRKTAGC